MPGALEACRQSCQKCRLSAQRHSSGQGTFLCQFRTRHRARRRIAIGWRWVFPSRSPPSRCFSCSGASTARLLRVYWQRRTAAGSPSRRLFLLTQIFLGGERWRSILCALMRGPPPSVASVQAVFYASIFFNCLPFGTVGGDVARVWLARRFALSLSQIVLSILVDRVLTVAALIMLALATLPTHLQSVCRHRMVRRRRHSCRRGARHPAARRHRTPARAMAAAAPHPFCPAHGGGVAPAEQRAPG